MTEDEFITETIRREGGDKFTNRADDAGGPTKFGITLDTLSKHRGHDCTAADVEALLEDEARVIYRERFLIQPRISAIPNDDVKGAVLDAAVMSGQSNAIKMLQRALGIADVDGVIGPVTLAAIPHLDGRRLALRVIAENIRFLGRIVTKNLTDADHDGIPDNTEMANGWFARKADQIESLA